MEEILNCNICDSEIDQEAGDVLGNFGISPVAFCVWCMSSMTDMVIQFQGFNDIDMLQERINELREEEKDQDYHNAMKNMYKNTQERIRQAKKEKDYIKKIKDKK